MPHKASNKGKRKRRMTTAVEKDTRFNMDIPVAEEQSQVEPVTDSSHQVVVQVEVSSGMCTSYGL